MTRPLLVGRMGAFAGPRGKLLKLVAGEAVQQVQHIFPCGPETPDVGAVGDHHTLSGGGVLRYGVAEGAGKLPAGKLGKGGSHTFVKLMERCSLHAWVP